MNRRQNRNRRITNGRPKYLIQGKNSNERRIIAKYKNVDKTTAKDWKIIHNKAMNAINIGDLKELEDWLIFLSLSFPCGKCRHHILDYMSKHPLPKNLKDKAAFKWSWEFHNAVNARLRKPFINWQDAVNMYY